MRRCTTCRLPLWIAWLIIGFGKRAVKFKDGKNCMDFLDIRALRKIQKEVNQEMNI